MRNGAPSLPRWVGWGVGVLIANTAYLAAFASPTPFYFANVVLHMLLGLALAISVAPSMVRAFGQLSIASRVGGVLAGAGALVGVAIMVAGAAGQFRWLLPTHIVLMIAGLVAAARRSARRDASTPAALAMGDRRDRGVARERHARLRGNRRQ